MYYCNFRFRILCILCIRKKKPFENEHFSKMNIFFKFMLIGPWWFILLFFFTTFTTDNKHNNNQSKTKEQTQRPILFVKKKTWQTLVWTLWQFLETRRLICGAPVSSLVPDSNQHPRSSAAEFPSAGSVCLCPLSSAGEARTRWAGAPSLSWCCAELQRRHWLICLVYLCSHRKQSESLRSIFLLTLT